MNVPWSQNEWRKVLVYGLGVSGRSAAQLLLRRGVEVVLADDRVLDETAVADLASLGGVELLPAGQLQALPEEIDGVVVSPGIPLDRPLVRRAIASQVPVIGEVELASLFVDGPLIAITGSNGKSTTTALTGALLESSGLDVEVCGNIGVPLSSRVDGPSDRVFVVEVSSFQLESIATFHPRVAALLNASPDHLDRHGTFQRYLAAKAAVFDRQVSSDIAVLNADDPRVCDLAVASRRRFFSRRRQVEDGCYVAGEEIVEAAPGEDPRPLFATGELALVGEHNLENAMAAALVARSLGAEERSFGSALSAFNGLPHRMERVVSRGGVSWINDSKGTNVGATLKSLNGFEDGTVHLILGGRAKGADFSPLIEEVTRAARRVYLLGEAAETLATLLPASVTAEPCGDLETAIESANSYARAGETILLSPACASFDQYPSFAHRGDHFRQLVQAAMGDVHG